MRIGMLLIQIIDKLFLVYMIMLFIRVISSWVPEFRDTKFVQFVSFYTDPYLDFYRRFIPPLGMIDISPIVAFLALGLIESIIKEIIAWIFF